MKYIIPNFLILLFGENVMKIRTKIAKLQMHENFVKNENETYFYENFHEFNGEHLKQQIFYSLTLLISYMVFNPFLNGCIKFSLF